MIYGVGTDVVEVSRIAKALERFGNGFAKIDGPNSEWYSQSFRS